jgi:predicted NUDIX family NTP pyrophosphohydrolase
VRSAGLLLYRRQPDLQTLLAHPGGPFWAKRDEGAWMIPKGLIEEGEEPLDAAMREFEEEMGSRPNGDPWPLATIRQKGGKWVEAFALESDLDADAISSDEFKVEWPPRSGRWQNYPEVDRAAWYSLPDARRMILPSQAPLLDALEAALKS